MRKDENGYIVVETVGSFMLFLFLITSILSLVNIVALQARVHYALTQAAGTFSMYSYTLEVTGIAKHLANLDSQASIARKEYGAFQADIEGILDGLQTLSPQDVGSHGSSAYNKVSGWVDDPKQAIAGIINCGLSAGSSELFGLMLYPLVDRYLSNGNMSGDEYLKSVNVIGGLDGLDFTAYGANSSVLIDSNGDIRVVVRYEIEYRFGTLPLPFEPKLTVTQVVKTKAWLNGSGKGYW